MRVHASILSLLLVAVCAAPIAALDILALAGPQPKLDTERRNAERAWLREHLIEAYKTKGRTNPKWDADVIRIAEWAIAYLTCDLEPMSRTDVVATAKRITGKEVGCDDVLVPYAAYLAAVPEWRVTEKFSYVPVNQWVNMGLKLVQNPGAVDRKTPYPSFVATDLQRWQVMTVDNHEMHAGNKATALRNSIESYADMVVRDLSQPEHGVVADTLLRRLLSSNELHTLDGNMALMQVRRQLDGAGVSRRHRHV